MSEWQPIESAPKDGRYVVVFVPHDERKSGAPSVRCCQWDAEYTSEWDEARADSHYVGAWTDGAVRSFGSEETWTYEPTHWMPLPEPPK